MDTNSTTGLRGAMKNKRRINFMKQRLDSIAERLYDLERFAYHPEQILEQPAPSVTNVTNVTNTAPPQPSVVANPAYGEATHHCDDMPAPIVLRYCQHSNAWRIDKSIFVNFCPWCGADFRDNNYF